MRKKRLCPPKGKLLHPRRVRKTPEGAEAEKTPNRPERIQTEKHTAEQSLKNKRNLLRIQNQLSVQNL